MDAGDCQNLGPMHGATKHEDGRPIELYHCADPQIGVCTLIDHGLKKPDGPPLQVCSRTCAAYKAKPVEPALVSCILPTYNMPARLSVLNEAVASFLAQDYSNKELIVVIDSQDQRLEFDHPQVRIFHAWPRFTSLGDKLRFAITQSRGKYVCRWDDDDISLPHRISQQVEAMQRLELDVYVPGGMWMIDGPHMGWAPIWGVGHCQGMFTREAYEKVGGYELRHGDEDYLINEAFKANCKWQVVPETASETGFLYRTGELEGVEHITEHRDNKAAFYESNAAKGIPGTYRIQPKWQRDYPSLVRCVAPTIKVDALSKPKTGIRLCVVGFPSKYGGADTELDHQITVWRAMGVEVSLIPTGPPDAGQLSLGVAERGCTIHAPKDWEKAKGCHVISYCNGDFLTGLPEIRKYAATTTFVNCMTWLFENEKIAHKNGWIDFFLYQTDHARLRVEGMLKSVNGDFRWAKVKPYFDVSAYPFVESRDDSVFSFCRVSRDDFHKYNANQFLIYQAIRSPVPKRGQVLGITSRIYSKTGQPPEYVKCLHPGERPPQEVYAESHCLIQNCDTYENLPRVAMEAMASGCVPIVDNRGGWTEIVTHGETGFLCSNSNEFVEAAEKLANDRELRQTMAKAARQRILDLYGFQAVAKEWEAFFGQLEALKPCWSVDAPMPMVEKAKSFLAVTGATVLSRLRGTGGLLSEQQINDRLAICQGCEKLNAKGVCGICSCSCNNNRDYINKLAHPTSGCPIGKW